MSLQTINVGTYANDGRGDDLRTAFEKVNANFTEIDAINVNRITGAGNVGTGAGIFKEIVDNTVLTPSKKLNFKSIVAGNNVSVTNNTNDITISTVDSINNLVEDTSPQLGGNLDLNGFIVYSNSAASLVVNNDNLTIRAINTANSNFNTVTINKLNISGGNLSQNGSITLSTASGNHLIVSAGTNLELRANNNISIISNNTTFNSSVTVLGTATFSSVVANNITADNFSGFFTGSILASGNNTITGPTIGSHRGNILANDQTVAYNATNKQFTGVLFNGKISDITDHYLEELADVGGPTPTSGDVLTWTGFAWEAKDPDSDPTEIDLGTFINPSSLDLDLGTVDAPASIVIDLGGFSKDIIGNIQINGSTIRSLDSSAIEFLQPVVFDSDVTIENDLYAMNKIYMQRPINLANFTTSQRDNIVSPEYGDLIYNETTNKFQGYAKDGISAGVDGWVDLH